MGKKCIEPTFCVVMFALCLSLAAITGTLWVSALFHGEWFRLALLSIFLVSQGVVAGSQVFFIANFFWRQFNEQFALAPRISITFGDDDRSTVSSDANVGASRRDVH